jgi:methylmalonyl-CoA mutase N-terminal domain/subunit
MLEGKNAEKVYKTSSGIPLKKIYWPEDIPEFDPHKHLGMPGEPPFVRGVYPDMYRQQPWRIFLLTGTGTTDDVRERVEYALKQGETGFICECDMASWLMFDIDHPDVIKRREDVGYYGAPIMSLNDYMDAWGKLPIGDVYCHFGSPFPQTTPFYLSCFLSVLEAKGYRLDEVNATGEGDFFIAYLGVMHPSLIPPTAALRLNCDGVEYARKVAPRLTPISIPGTNARESGANAYQEMAMVLACATAHIDEILARGNLKIDDFAVSIGGINLSVGSDFFEDIAKFRAMRRMWYKLLTEKYNAQNPRSLRLRIHALPLGSIYTYQQPLNNIVRGGYTVLAAILGGANSIGTPSFDEAICTPSQLAHTTALRTQQILLYESNTPWVIDPLGGSYYVEWLTNEMESKAWEYLQKIEAEGGFIACLESGWLQKEVARESTENILRIDSGETKVVGVNCCQGEEEPYKFEPFRPNPKTWEIAMEKLEKLRRERDAQRVEKAKMELRRALVEGENTIPPTIEAVKSLVTIGEIGDMYRDVFGCWRVPDIVASSRV